MENVLVICSVSACLTVCLLCGSVLWLKRQEVHDHSRVYLAAFGMLVALTCVTRILSYARDTTYAPYGYILPPFLSVFGLFFITLFMIYPIEVMRPRWLKGWHFLVPFIPTILITVMVFAGGGRFQNVTSFAYLWEHLLDFDVLLRLAGAVGVTGFSVLLLVIPYNWRESSADYHWVIKTTLIAQGISVFFYGQVFSTYSVFYCLHMLWIAFAMAYFTYYELEVRVLPARVPEPQLSQRPETVQRQQVEMWEGICQVMDFEEVWRNPNTTVETVSRALGTNRIYVARCIREHTGLSFNDFMNSKRVEYVALQLRLQPQANLKEIFFSAGFRSRDTANRNFAKFKGCSPTEFVSLS